MTSLIDLVLAGEAPRDEITALLDERSPIYSGLGEADAERIRALLLGAFEQAGLPEAALPYVAEELETGRNPDTVAAAAMALRGAGSVGERLVRLLLEAIDRLGPTDRYLSADRPGRTAADGGPSTAVEEMFRTVASLGPSAACARAALEEMASREPPAFSPGATAALQAAIAAVPAPVSGDFCCGGAPPGCCASGAPSPSEEPYASAAAIRSGELQDRSGSLLTFGEFFLGRPGILAFFYTRCGNPERCSLTIAKLARLQKLAAAVGLAEHISIAAISYGPAFDLPHRLYAYGKDRGMSFSERGRMLRTTGDLSPLRHHFRLGVGFGPVTVNRHRLELFVLDEHGDVAATFARRQWSEQEVLDAVRPLLAADGRQGSARSLHRRSNPATVSSLDAENQIAALGTGEGRDVGEESGASSLVP